MDHASAADFVPAGFAELATAAVAESAGEVDFETGFGELKMERTNPTFGFGPVEVAGEVVDGAF